MTSALRAGALGATLVVLLVPAYAGAQRGARAAVGGASRPPAPAPRPAPGPLTGGGTVFSGDLRGSTWDRGHRVGRSGPQGQNPHGFVPCFDGSLRCVGSNTRLGPSRPAYPVYPYVYSYESGTAVPYQAPVYIPYPVAVPQPINPPVPEPAEPAKPYNPANSRMLTIGGGADGGGGVMRIERATGATLRVTWLGSTRRVREATLFLADSQQQPLLTQSVALGAPTAVFKLTGLEPRVAYTGLTTIFADGATQTTLVPFARGK